MLRFFEGILLGERKKNLIDLHPSKVYDFLPVNIALSFISHLLLAQSGISLVGDAVHTFPQNLGEGVNSGLEKQSVHDECLTKYENLDEATEKYGKQRGNEVNENFLSSWPCMWNIKFIDTFYFISFACQGFG